MASTNQDIWEDPAALAVRFIMLLAIPPFFIFMYTRVFDWVKSDNPLYSSTFGIGSQRAEQVAAMLGPKLDFYVQVLIEHGFSIIMAAALCAPFVKMFFRNIAMWYTLSYSMIAVFALFFSHWLESEVFRYMGSNTSYQLVVFSLILLPQCVLGIYYLLTSK